LYCVQSHFSLCVGILFTCLPISSKKCVDVPCVWMVGVVAIMSLSGLHSVMSRCICVVSVGGYMYLVSLCCLW
jgi:hypothetical protein